MVEILQQPESPEKLAREAGKKIYGTVVGCLRRSELSRLGNAWGIKFPVGATKDYMLPYFKQLEAEGKDPFRPPHAVPARGIHSQETHVEETKEVELNDYKPVSVEPDISQVEVSPEPDPFAAKLAELKFSELRKLAKARGIPQTNTDRKVDLVARIADAAKEGENEQDVSQRS